MPLGANTSSVKRLLGLLAVLTALLLTVALSHAVGFTYASFNSGSGNRTNVVGNDSLGAPTLAVPTPSGAGATGTVDLSWTVPSGDPSNQSIVLRGASACPPGTFTTIATPSATSYTDTPGAAGVYCYEIEGKLGNWTSQPSNQQTMTVYELPVLIQSTSDSAASATSVSASFSSNPVAGHLLVAVLGARDDTVINAPSGWSTAINESGVPSQAIFYKIAAGSSDKSVTVTTSVATRLGLSVLEYSGITAASELDQTVSATGKGGTVTFGSVTTTQRVELLVAAATVDGNISTTGYSDSFTLEIDFQNKGQDKADFSAADRIVYTTGTYTTTTTTSGGSPGDWRGQIVAFKAGTN